MNKPITRRITHPTARVASTGAALLEKRIAALEANIDEIIAQRQAGKSSVDPRTLVELVDKRLKEALDARFRVILGHLENDVIPRAVKKHTSGAASPGVPSARA